MSKPGGTPKVQSAIEFHATRYWPQLDGLRTLSVALVIFSHMGDPVWSGVNGSLGVTLFFVISGFLITSLLIREERRNGRVSLSKFYVRRVYRIVPLYYIAVALTAVAVFGLGLGVGSGNFAERLPLIATFNGEFAGSGTFSHSWSLGIEEKFYILWPLVAFALPFVIRKRAVLVAVLLPLVAAASYIPGLRYFGIYTAIVAGCALAIAMHSDRGFRAAQALARPRAFYPILALAVLVYLVDQSLPFARETGHAHVAFAIATALVFPGLIIGGSAIQRVLSWRPIAYVGTLAYGIYLFHPFCIDVVGLVLPAGETSIALAALRFLLAAMLSVGVAFGLHKLIEQPFIRLGRRLTTTDSKPGTMPASETIATIR